jgi:hypothetical protein
MMKDMITGLLEDQKTDRKEIRYLQPDISESETRHFGVMPFILSTRYFTF